MKLLTKHLEGNALNYAVAIATGIPAEEIKLPAYKGDGLWRWLRDEDGYLDGRYMTGPNLLFSTMWKSGGPILEQEGIGIRQIQDDSWIAHERGMYVYTDDHRGATPLIAAMRCFVFTKLGQEVEIPEQLL